MYVYKSRKEKNKINFKESINIILAVIIVVISGIIYAAFNNLNKNVANKDDITIQSKENFQEFNEVENSSVAEELSVVRVGTISEGVQTLANTFENVKDLNEDIETYIVSNMDNDELVLSLINGDQDIIIISRQLNIEEKLLIEQSNIKYEELLFSYLNISENNLLYLYINIDSFNNNLACRLLLKGYYNLKGDNLELEALSPLPENIYEEISSYLSLLDIYPKK